MAFSLNKVMLIGNLGQDAETRFTTNNKAVTNFSLATTHSYKGKDGEWVNETTWHNCMSWDLPDFFKDALKKGAKFYVEGRIQKREYTDKEGIKRYVTEIVTDKLIPLDKSEHSSQSSENHSGSETRTGSFEPPAVDQAGQDDDLPF